MSDGQLVKVNELTGAMVPSMDAFDAVSASSFLPQLKLGGSQSEPVKEGKVKMGAYYTKSGEAVTDHGSEVDAIAITWQPKALDYSDRENIVSSTDHQSELFKEIKAKADVKDSECLCGFEFLVWLKEENKFVTFYLCSKSQKKVAPELNNLLGKAATFKSKLVKNAKFSWHVPVFTECPTPMTPPANEAINDAIVKFKAESASETEVVKDDSGRER